MKKWFIYCGTNYYPSYEVVEAETPEDAVELSSYDEYDRPLLVYPDDARALTLGVGDEPSLSQLTDEVQRATRDRNAE